MGVHLVFFLHITTGADNTNNVLALGFGLLIVFLVIGGSLWIMANLNHNMSRWISSCVCSADVGWDRLLDVSLLDRSAKRLCIKGGSLWVT